MRARKGDINKAKSEGSGQVGATISFPPDIYGTLKDIAREKKVSLAWGMQKAFERHAGDKKALFGGEAQTS